MIRAPWASDPGRSRGRAHPEAEGALRGPRTAFQRDRDRIIHSTGFRRLRHKTQVFVAPDGDHFRVRLTHSLEVAQIARTMARALALDEDLTEAIALAHDIGHPPFGHAGEAALQTALADVGGFDHNGHTLRVLTRLDSPYAGWRGLNLTWEALEGLAKHNGPVTAPPWALAEVNAGFGLDLSTHAGPEAQVAALADDIAYDNHDIDDGLRAGLLDLDEVAAHPALAARWAGVTARLPGASRAHLTAELVREQIGAMVGDALAETARRIETLGPDGPGAIRAAPHVVAAFSDGMAATERDFKRFMYQRLYHHPSQRAVAARAHEIVAGLVELFRHDPALLPEGWREELPAGEPGRARHIGDFIAGMTDRYAIARYEALIGPSRMPAGF